MRRRRVHGDIARDLPCCHDALRRKLAVAQATYAIASTRAHCSFVRSNANNSHRLRAHECTYKPLVLWCQVMTDGFSRPYATVARVARSFSRRTTVVQPENRRAGRAGRRAGAGHEIDGLRGCPINASEHRNPRDEPRNCPTHTCGRRSPGGPRPRSHKSHKHTFALGLVLAGPTRRKNSQRQ